MKSAIIQPEREIEDMWRYFRINEEFDENPLKKMYSLGGAYFGAPKSNQGLSALEGTLSNSYALKGSTIYGGNSRFSNTGSIGGMTSNPAAAYNSYFMKGAKSSSYSTSGTGKSSYSSSTSYAGGKSGCGSSSAGGGK